MGFKIIRIDPMQHFNYLNDKQYTNMMDYWKKDLEIRLAKQGKTINDLVPDYHKVCKLAKIKPRW